MSDVIRLLLVEDNPGDARLLEELLKDVPGQPCRAERVATLASAAERLQDESFDAVLLDLGLPDSQGLATLSAARSAAPHLPIVVLTGLDDEAVGVEAMQLGAQDYLLKGRLEGPFLVRAVRHAVERNQIEETLRQTLGELESRTEEMESFTYSVSHDLKEPLRTIEAFSGFLLEDYNDLLDEQGQDYLQRLQHASARLKDMIEELLILARLGRRPHEYERVGVADVVEGIIAAAAATIEAKAAIVQIDGLLPDVRADAPRIEQIFGNLIGNGLKFGNGAQPVIEVGVRDIGGGRATFYVRDNGIGISPEYHDRIFGIFQRLHLREEYEGTGAGLAIVRRAAEALGGRVWVESELDAGSTFFVQLPLWSDEEEEIPPQEELRAA